MTRQSILILLLSCVLAQDSRAQQPQSKVLSEVRIDQKLRSQVPLDLKFRDELGHEVALASYFTGKPVILVLAYYRCPMLCTQVLNGLADCMKNMSLELGSDYRVLTVSIDPRETPTLAAEKKKSYLSKLQREDAGDNWHFVVGEEQAIQRLSDSVGYRFAYDADKDQFAHGSGIIVLTPSGQVSRYLMGIAYPANDLKLALVEASAGKIGSLADRLLLLCFHYDESTGRYTPAVMAIVRIMAVVTLMIVVAFILSSIWRDRRPAIKHASLPSH
jgi:protein SCO1/2